MDYVVESSWARFVQVDFIGYLHDLIGILG